MELALSHVLDEHVHWRHLASMIEQRCLVVKAVTQPLFAIVQFCLLLLQLSV